MQVNCARDPDASAEADSAVSSPPQRIIALAPNAVEIVWDLGAGDRLVGVSEYASYPQEVRRLPRIGGLRDPDLERILALEPDLVILRGRQANLEQVCRERGIAVYHDPTDTLADVYRTVRDLGRLLDRQDQAEALIRRMREHLEALQRRAAALPRTKTLLVMRNADRLANIGTVARGSYLHDVLEQVGGDNVFRELEVAYPQVSVEEILARAPEVIIELPGDSAGDGARRIEQWQVLSAIPAVRDGRVHVIADDFALVPSPRLVLLAEKLFVLLHPAGPDSDD